MAVDYRYLRASDGTGNAALAHITANRIIGSMTLEVDTLDNWPPFFIGTAGTPDADGYITAANMTEFRGHTDSGDIIIDSFEPGFTDVGNTTAQIVVVKQATGWADMVSDGLSVSHNNDGTLKNGIVTTAIILDSNVTAAKLAPSAVTSEKVATDSHIIAYVEGLTTGQSTTSTSYVDATGITVTFTTPASCTKIMLRASGPSSNDTATVNYFAITDSANAVQVERPKAHSVGNVNLIDTFALSRRITVTASTSYTFKLRFKVGGGTGVINQGNVSDRPTCLWVERA